MGVGDRLKRNRITRKLDKGKRGTLQLGLWAVGSAFVGGMIGGAGSSATGGIINVSKGFLGLGADKNLGEVFRAFTGDRVPSVSVGNYNLAAAAQGKPQKQSMYIRRAATGISGGLCGAFPNFEPNVCNDPTSTEYDELKDAIMLGGPFANPRTAGALRYDLSREDRLLKGVPNPKARADFNLRFEFLNGETTRGEFDGVVSTALRYDKGEEIERPIFRVLDRKTGKVWTCETDNGWLANEYLQIIRLLDKDGFLKTFIWGLHGHSISGFFKPGEAILENMNELLARTNGMDQFHALIPMKLDRKRAFDGPYMQATADWAIVDRYGMIANMEGDFIH